MPKNQSAKKSSAASKIEENKSVDVSMNEQRPAKKNASAAAAGSQRQSSRGRALESANHVSATKKGKQQKSESVSEKMSVSPVPNKKGQKKSVSPKPQMAKASDAKVNKREAKSETKKSQSKKKMKESVEESKIS